MSDRITLADLRQILVESAGEDDLLLGDIEHTPFAELGYDSLALIETAALIKQRFGVQIADDAIAGLATPAEVLDLVNGTLVEAG
ncbi:acyl carrier protein [Kutzneria buriramensis]|uniref:Act minimal PKS acyl carrier protein n=1 Tax=Kutzneria buriramensis TaxID=1045776 RepID=A0A3E0GYF6_9PSEU|nr:acyl carrier protein [Kutzneria buriramensis]REH32559.1 act minimal PKS acyl carrier protein [Kutzneria buriramensis]